MELIQNILDTFLSVDFSYFLEATSDVSENEGVVSVEELLNSVDRTGIIGAAITAGSAVAKNVIPVISLFLLIRVGISISDSFLRGTPIDIPGLAPQLLLILFVMNYETAVMLVHKGTDLMVELTDVTEFMEGSENFGAKLDKTLMESSTAVVDNNSPGMQENEKSWGEEAMDDISEGFGAVLSVDQYIKSTFTQLISSSAMYILRWIVQILVTVIIAILIVLGPIAAMITSIPGIGDKMLRNWLSSFIAIKVWLMILNVVDALSVSYYTMAIEPRKITDVKGLGDQFLQSNMLLVYNCVFILCYIAVPFLASLVIKSDAGGAIMAKAVEAGKAAKTGGASLASSAAGAVSGYKSGGISGAMSGAFSSLQKQTSKQSA